MVRAVVMPAPNAPLEVWEMAEPVLQPGGVVLRTSMSEVCGTDVHLFHGRLAGVPYPIIPGHVSVGTIEGLRGEVRDVDGALFREGDVAAFLDVHETCGACHYCLVAKQSTRCPARRVYGITYGADEGLLGGWAEKIWLKPGVKLLRLPPELSPETYCGGGCGVVTALHAIDRAEIQLEDSVAVLGIGPVGLSAVALARLSGAGEVIAVGDSDKRRAFARRMGATLCVGLDVAEHDRASTIVERTGRGADVVIEASGDPRAVRQGLDIVRDGGRVVVCGQYTDGGEVVLNPHTAINKKHVELRGCWGSDFSHFHRAARLMARHQADVPWRDLIDARFDLDHCADALRAVETRSVIKAAIVPS